VQLKKAIVTPVIKKHGLDSADLSNYRPVSNLPILAKVIERAAETRLVEHIEKIKALHPLQSAYRRSRSTETATLRVLSDWRKAFDNGRLVCVVSLDVSSAFDTISHNILLRKLKSHGITGSSYAWFRSYLSGRSCTVKYDSTLSMPKDLNSGVPQGSILGPILFNIYMAELASALTSPDMGFHIYADDVLLYVVFTPADMNHAFSKLQSALDITEVWMKNNHLQLNSRKTESLLLCHRRSKFSAVELPKLYLQASEIKISADNSFRWLGVLFDQHLSMSSFIDNTCQAAFRQLHMLSRIRASLDTQSAMLLVNALVLQKLDYCNSLLYISTAKDLHKMDRVLRFAARVISCKRKFDPVSDTMMDMKWLPARKRISFKLLCIVFKTLSTGLPEYLADDLCPYCPNRSLRSGDQKLLDVPGSKLRIGEGCFGQSGSLLWNSLPMQARLAKTYSTFRSFAHDWLLH
jgi:hypothetical protein